MIVRFFFIVFCSTIICYLDVSNCAAQQKKLQPKVVKDTTAADQPQPDKLLSPILSPQKNKPSSASQIKIGLLYNQDQPNHHHQFMMVKHAVSEINAIPGVKNITLVVGNYHKTEETIVPSIVDSLVKQTITLLLVFGTEQIVQKCLATIPKTLPVFLCSELHTDFIKSDKENIWKLFPPLYKQGILLAQMIDTSKYKKAALVIQDSVSQQKCVDFFTASFTQSKGIVTSTIQCTSNTFGTKLLDEVFKGKPDIIVLTSPFWEWISSLTTYGTTLYKNLPHKKVLYLTTSMAFFDSPQYKAQPVVFENIRGFGLCIKHSQRISRLKNTLDQIYSSAMGKQLLLEIIHPTTAYPLLAVYDLIYVLHLADIQLGLLSVENLTKRLPSLLLARKDKEKITNEVYKNVPKFVKSGKEMFYECMSSLQSFDSERYAQGIPFLEWRISEGNFVQTKPMLFNPY